MLYRIILSICLIILAIVMRVASPALANASFILIAVYAMLGIPEAIFAIALTWLFTMANEGLCPDASFVSIVRYVVICMSFCSVALRLVLSRIIPHVNANYICVIVFALFVVVHSCFISSMILVSLLKVASWCGAYVTVFLAWSALDSNDYNKTGNQLFYGLCAISVLSILFIFSEVGYIKNGYGFQGILNQPQAFGLLLAIVCAWLVSKVLVERNFPWFCLVLLFICIFLIYMSRCRTAGFALILAVISAVSLKLIFNRSYVCFRDRWFLLKRSSILLAFCFLPCLILGALFPNVLHAYIIKGHNNVEAASIYEESRGVFVDRMLVNIKNNLYTGIGFGIASDALSMNVATDPYWGMPVSVSVEKGVLPIAVFEETGVVGFVLFCIMIGFFIVSAINNGLPQIMVLLTALYTNLAECTFFSVGGMGMIIMIVISWSVMRNSSHGCLNTWSLLTRSNRV